MDPRLVKMFLSILCLAFAAHLIQGASQCVRSNNEPSRHCAVKCTVQTDCGNSREKCLCDGDCGFSCVNPRMRCSKPRKVRNGQIIFKSYRFNATQRAVCNHGFRLTGSAVRTCRGKGYWDRKQARCRRLQKNCQDPGMKGLLLRTTEERTSFKPGTKLSYYCPHKFVLRGSRELICNGDGTWSASLPKCIAPKCRPAVLPAHTQVSSPRNWKNRRKYGIRFTLSCKNGYTSTQRGTLVCDAPGWRLEPSSFKCFPVKITAPKIHTTTSRPTSTTTRFHTTIALIKSCQDPGTPWKVIKKGNLQVGQTLHFSCPQCYQLKGSPTRTCQSDLSWSGSQPTCTVVRCSNLHHPTNGRIIEYSKHCGGKQTEFICYSGYQLRGSRRITCQSDGRWSAASPTCVAVNIATPKIHTTTSRPTSTTTRFHTTIALIKSCQDPGTPWKVIKKGNLQVGQTLHFSCPQCYQLKGSPTRTCQSDLSWSGSQPTCTVVRCSNLHHPRNGRIIEHSKHCGGKQTEFICYSGYQLRGSRRITCQSDGRWSAASPTCVAVKINPLPKAKAKRIPTTKAVLQPSMAPTTTPKTHTTTSSPTATTQFLTTVALKSSCGNPVLSPKARIRLHRGTLLLIGCKENYVTLTTGLMRCGGNTWRSVKDPACLAKTCSNPGIPKNGYKHGLSYFVGDVVTFTCDSCYRLVGDSKRTCLKNGIWSYTQPMCFLKTCPSLQDTNQATVFYISQECDDVAAYTCKDTRLTMLGSGEKICNKSGMWEGAEPKCINPDLNIALGKPASMSSYWKKYGGPASDAVDGKRGGRFLHTKHEYGSWVKIDLLKEDTVSTVIVVNRRDCCISRINGFKVSVGNNGNMAGTNTECGGRPIAKAGPNIIQCPKTLRGRYVFVYMPEKKYTSMVLLEVEVYRRRMTE